MTALSPMLYLCYLSSILEISSGNGINIHVYKNHNFTRLIWESNSTAACNNITQDKWNYVYSIRTNSCFIAYQQPDCKALWSVKYMPGDIILSSDQLGRHGWIRSFHSCNENEGGSLLHIDITKLYEYSWVVPHVLESYRNVCSCVNIPQYVQNMFEWSINNHHNDLLAYYEPDCSKNKWDPKLIEAGHNYAFTDMHRHKKLDLLTNTTYKIQSLGPYPNSPYFHSSCKWEVLTNQIVKLQTEFDLSRRQQDNFQSDIVKQQKDDLNQLTDKISQLQQQFQNFAAQIKFDLRELFA